MGTLGAPTGWSKLPDGLAFSKTHHTVQLWAPLLDDQQHLADTRGRHIVVAPYLDLLLVGGYQTLADFYYDATPEELMLHVIVWTAMRSTYFLDDCVVYLRVTLATTAGANLTQTITRPLRVTRGEIDLTADQLTAAHVRMVPYPQLGEESLLNCYPALMAEHNVDPALPTTQRRLTVEVQAAVNARAQVPPVYVRSLLVVGYRRGL